MNAAVFQRLQNDANFQTIVDVYEKAFNSMASDPDYAVGAARQHTKDFLIQKCGVDQKTADTWVANTEEYRRAAQQPGGGLRESALDAGSEAEHASERTPQGDSVTEMELIDIVKNWVEEDEVWDDKMSVEEMVDRLKEVVAYRPPRFPISNERITEIVSTYAPNAPRSGPDFVLDDVVSAFAPTLHPKPKPTQTRSSSRVNECPPELKPLVDAGHAVYSHGRKGWAVKRCFKCGQFNLDECCGQKTGEVGATYHGELTKYGRQAVGLEPIPQPKTQEQKQEETREGWATTDWWRTFSGFDELEDGGLKMYIENFLPEGVTIITSLPKEGKTWLALSIVKALTTGRPLFGKKGYEVLEQAPVLYLAAEAGDRAFKHRVSKFRITNDKTKFLCRTLTKGMIGLQNPDLEAAVRALKPVVILDVLSCFNQSDDEDDSVQNQKLRSMIGNLRTQGAPVIIVLHHTTKDFKDKPTKERAVRGSGDILAMVDVVWALMLDDRLAESTGVKEVDVIGWGRDIEAYPFRLALTKKATEKNSMNFAPGVASIIDTTGDLGWVDKEAVRQAAEKASQDLAATLEQMVQANPKASIRELAATVGKSFTFVRDALLDKGWTRGKSKHAVWTQEV